MRKQNSQLACERVGINPDVEDLLDQTAALNYCKELSGKRPSPSTFHRWRMVGVANVRLETLLIANRCFTSRQALHRFFNKSSVAKSERLSKATSAGIAKAKRRRQEQAEDLADEMGL